MAFFGAPIGHEDHSSSAVRCALAMQERLKGLSFTRFPDLHLNMWWDADVDALMTRTRKRPIPDGRIRPEEALALGMMFL